jgi:2-keto-4-pentenoate hydratase/2-oxohepta-3-ene-1,7-dioic acid hydratase in catechol pathway
LNDLSARDMQLKSMSSGGGPGKGKDFDKSNPMGPCIVTADEIPDPFDLSLRIAVNGEEWSRTSTRNPHWRFVDFLAHASQSQTIRAGEIFSTGCTPFGCAVELQRSVKAGDTIELDVERIGVLRTHLR